MEALPQERICTEGSEWRAVDRIHAPRAVVSVQPCPCVSSTRWAVHAFGGSGGPSAAPTHMVAGGLVC